MSATVNLPYRIQGNRLTVTSAGTPVRFSSSTLLVRGLKLWAEGANTGYIYVQSSSTASGTHARLPAGTTAATNTNAVIDFGDAEIDLSQVYFDASANNMVVSAVYLLAR